MTVAIPVRNGRPLLDGVLAALAAQTRDHELLICDSGSSDGSQDLARRHGARLIEIAPEEFGHGRTRNLLMGEAKGDHVAFLTQDAEPAGAGWLEALLSGFCQDPDVALVYGPYRPRPQASAAVRAELERWFTSLSPEGRPAIERLLPEERSEVKALLLGRRGFFTDANACISREAWERVPFREIGYAEDRALALDMLLDGYAKCYVPGAAVLHSHDYAPREQLRRSFDEARALQEVYGWREPLTLGHVRGQLVGPLVALDRDLRVRGADAPARLGAVARAALGQGARVAGAIVGSRADRLPARAQRSLSLERRSGSGSEASGRQDTSEQ